MAWRRASDRLQRDGTILGGLVMAFAGVLKFVHPDTSDTLVLGILGIGQTLVHPSWLFDKVRKWAAERSPEDEG